MVDRRQEELGRPLTEVEVLDWLKELGPPMMMASRYQPSRYLIGPNLFGVYWLIMRLSLVWASVAFARSSDTAAGARSTASSASTENQTPTACSALLTP